MDDVLKDFLFSGSFFGSWRELGARNMIELVYGKPGQFVVFLLTA